LRAYVRLPRSSAASTSWLRLAATGDEVDHQVMREVLLRSDRSGREHLPEAIRRAGPQGLPLLVTRDKLVIGAMRLLRFSPPEVDLQADELLARRWIGTSSEVNDRRTVQILLAYSIPAPVVQTPPPILAPGHRPVPRTARPAVKAWIPQPAQHARTDAEIRAVMDQPPNL
jgi:hypothetical protein